MRKIEAKVVADSITPGGSRLVTLECQFPRIILSQVNTHRAFSRNSASSRAIPTSKMIKSVKDDPYIPIKFGANQKGMQPGEEVGVTARWKAENTWRSACANAIHAAEEMFNLGIHKEVVNRLLEPFQWHKAIISATEWAGFFNQRLFGEGAQEEIHVLAFAIHEALRNSNPCRLAIGDYHLPYVLPEEIGSRTMYACMKMSVARCARVSYLNHDGERNVQSDFALFERLYTAKPPHLSPFEHVACATDQNEKGNFSGWKQLRHSLSESELGAHMR
jgi:hypothetical protein